MTHAFFKHLRPGIGFLALAVAAAPGAHIGLAQASKTESTAPSSNAVAADGAQAAEKTSHAHADLSQGDASFDAAISSQLEVKRCPTGHLLVRPVLNGRQAGWFIFDTGAGICVISTPHKDEFDLTAKGSIAAIGVGGGENAKLLRASKLTIGPLTLRDHPIMATDLSFLRAHLGEEIIGVLGFGVLSRCVAEIDIQTPRIALHDPATFRLTAGEWTPMSLDNRVPSVEAKFEGRPGRFMLDTGANSSVTINSWAVKKYELLTGREITDSRRGGVGGFVPAKKGTLTSMELGGMRHENVPADFALEEKGGYGLGNRDGQIGAELLRHYVLFLDYEGERIAFVRHK